MTWTRAAVLLLGAAQAAAAQGSGTGAEEAQGMYTITSVNRKLLPAATWKRETSDTVCATATQNGVLLLDSKGSWALLVTERDRCTHGTKRWTMPDVSTLSTGTYTNEGGTVTLTEGESGTVHRATLTGGRITVEVNGSDPFKGQSAVFVLRRQQSVRKKG